MWKSHKMYIVTQDSVLNVEIAHKKNGGSAVHLLFNAKRDLTNVSFAFQFPVGHHFLLNIKIYSSTKILATVSLRMLQ